jgi:NUMOD4 motif/NUMOD1 domain
MRSEKKLIRKQTPLYNSLSLTNLPGERWKDLPGSDSLYRISNYGRLKRLRRWCVRDTYSFWLSEKIIKTQVIVAKRKSSECWGLNIKCAVKIEKKVIQVPVAKMVYHLFVKKINLSDINGFIEFKDSNPLNVFSNNLILSTRSKVALKAYQQKRRPRDSFGKKARPIIQYNESGNRIAVFESINQASAITGIEGGWLADCLKHGDGYAGGFIWQYGRGPERLKKINKSLSDKIVSRQLYKEVITQYSIEGERIQVHKNIKEAGINTGIKTDAIKKACDNKSLSAGGFCWFYGSGPLNLTVNKVAEAKRQRILSVVRPVTQYDLTGQRIAHYESQAEASRKTGVSPYQIFSGLVGGETQTAGGFIWRYGKGEKRIKVAQRIIRAEQLKRLYVSAVTQYDKTGKRIAVLRTVKEAATIMRGQVNSLVAVLEGKTLSFKGFFWLLGKGHAKIDTERFKTPVTKWLKRISKPVVQYTLAGKKIGEYRSLRAAQDATGGFSSSIGAAAAGKLKTANGFIWKFVENNSKE